MHLARVPCARCGAPLQEDVTPLRVIAMCGLAFSGKSTAARRIAARLSCPLISLDTINAERGLDGGKGLTVAQWEEASAIAMGRLRDDLQQRRSVVVDDTHSHRVLRDRCRAVAAQNDANFALVFMATPIATIAARRVANHLYRQRPPIDDAVFEAHRAGFQFPSSDEAPVVIAGKHDLQDRLERQGIG